MKHIRRAAALACALLLALTLFGCKKAEETPPEDDVIYDLIGVKGSDTVLTVDGSAIDAETFCYWLYSAADSHAGDDGAIDWAADTGDGTTTAQAVLADAQEIAVLYRTVEDHAVSLGCTLGEDDQKELDELRAQYISSLGDEESYLSQLRLAGLGEETFMHFNKVTQYYNKLLEKLYLADGATYAPTEEELTAYADKTFQGYGFASFADYIAQSELFSAKHILLLTKDLTTGEAYTAERIAEQKAAAEELLRQLRASEDPTALFDELMFQYSEDSGLATNPDGYLYSSGSMTAEFESAVEALEAYAISDIVESAYGYHIIMRLPITAEEMREDYCNESLAALADEWVTAAKVERTAVYDAIDPQKYYDALAAARKAAEEAEASASPEASPAASPSAS